MVFFIELNKLDIWAVDISNVNLDNTNEKMNIIDGQEFG